jgi:hypothetical protein
LDNIKEIAIANIAANIHKLLPTSNSLWHEILACSGQKELYNKYFKKLNPYNYSGSYEHENPQYSPFDGIYGVLNDIYATGNIEELNSVLLNSLSRLDYFMLFNIQDGKYVEFVNEFERMRRKLSPKDFNTFLEDNFREEFIKLRNCLNILGLTLIVNDNKTVTVNVITDGTVQRVKDVLSLENWLEVNFPETYSSYNDALNGYKNSRPASCIEGCRATLTGFFSHFKVTENWFNGILAITKENYSNPEVISKMNDASKIFRDSKSGELSRFKAIYRIYSMQSDLGTHRNEGVVEEPNMADALMNLRFTEDVLLWGLMNTLEAEKDK